MSFSFDLICEKQLPHFKSNDITLPGVLISLQSSYFRPSKSHPKGKNNGSPAQHKTDPSDPWLYLKWARLNADPTESQDENPKHLPKSLNRQKIDWRRQATEQEWKELRIT